MVDRTEDTDLQARVAILLKLWDDIRWVFGTSPRRRGSGR